MRRNGKGAGGDSLRHLTDVNHTLPDAATRMWQFRMRHFCALGGARRVGAARGRR